MADLEHMNLRSIISGVLDAQFFLFTPLELIWRLDGDWGDLWRSEAWKEREAYDIPFLPDAYGEACQPYSGDIELILPSGGG